MTNTASDQYAQLGASIPSKHVYPVVLDGHLFVLVYCPMLITDPKIDVHRVVSQFVDVTIQGRQGSFVLHIPSVVVNRRNDIFVTIIQLEEPHKAPNKLGLEAFTAFQAEHGGHSPDPNINLNTVKIFKARLAEGLIGLPYALAPNKSAMYELITAVQATRIKGVITEHPVP